MKQYKVGDTIYVKCIIAQIDKNDYEKPYGIKFVDREYCTQAWPHRSVIIDELPTTGPVKPVLPKEVADELEIAKKSNVSFDVYIVQIISGNADYYNSREFWINSDDDVTKTLMDAWNNGYTVEEEKYNLVIGTDSRNNRVCIYHIADEAHIDGYTIESDLNSSLYQFTQSEIDKYNKDFWIKNVDLNDYKVEVKDDDDED